ncbi:MAG: arylsulfatase [Flavobacteriales bacterium]|nr:arylsulfatase [Flavobacteriales bacterium]
MCTQQPADSEDEGSVEGDKKVNPNIIVIYADDLGFGDLSSYGASELSTPNIDRIANEGIKFTNGYASSATCTPSRYALLTGLYPWKNKEARILKGNAPLLINPSLVTMPDMMKKAGYVTSVVGKWHLGLGGATMDWNKKVYPGPNDIGFDYSYIVASTNDRVPTVYVENDMVVGLDPADPIEVSYKENFEGEPTGKENPELLKMHPSHGHDMSVHNGISRIGYMKGGKSALWIDEDISDTILSKATDFITANVEKPFFLFYSLHQPHVPRTPHGRFVGLSGMGPRGDAILEVDFVVGEVLALLKKFDIDDNTIIVFSSDNGPVLDDGYHDDAVTKLGNHTPSGVLRGGKYSLFDAGTHVPFMVRWPGTVKPGTSDALVCQMDLFASFASMLEQEMPPTDSENVLDALLGNDLKGRDDLVLEARSKTCYRSGEWAMIPPYNGSTLNKSVNIETGRSEEYQLYNLSADPSQQNNLATSDTAKLAELRTQFEQIVTPQ